MTLTGSVFRYSHEFLCETLGFGGFLKFIQLLVFHVFRVFMLPQVNLALESGATIPTGEWLNPSMLTHVCNQIAALTECLATNATLVRFLPYGLIVKESKS